MVEEVKAFNSKILLKARKKGSIIRIWTTGRYFLVQNFDNSQL